MTSGTGSGLVSRNKEGTQIVLAQFPPSGSTLSAFGLTPSIIKTIAIPNDIQDWPTTALNGCTALEKLTTFGMPAKEATIVLSLDHGLQNLTKLTFLRFPSTLQKTADGFVSTDGSGSTFPRSLQSVSFQDCFSLESIGLTAFQCCASLVHLNFSGCSSLRSLGQDSINRCTALVHIDLSGCSSLKSLELGVFYEDTSLVYIDLSSCPLLQTMEDWVFGYCSKLQTVIFPASLTTIGNFSFKGETSLVQIDLSVCPSLQSIGDWAFQNCPQLQMVILPTSLTTIGSGAFYGDTALKTVYWMGSGPAANIASNAFPSGVEHVYNYKP